MNEIELYGVIGEGELTAAAIKGKLQAFADQQQPLTVHFDTPGGHVFAGTPIRNAFADYPGPKKAIVDAFAGSIASYILTAFDEVDIVSNGFVMIHNPSMESGGDDIDHARSAKLLADIKSEMISAYAQRMDMDGDEVAALMRAETFYTAEESLEVGLATRVLNTAGESKIPTAYRNSLPHRVFASLNVSEAPKRETPPATEETTMPNEPVAATVQEIKAAYPKMPAEFVLACVEKQMPIAQVAVAASETLTAQNEALAEENAKLTAQIEALNAKAMEEEEEAKAEEEAEAEAKAQAQGHTQVEGVTGGNAQSARAAWKAAVASYTGMPRAKAVRLANKNNPGLRQKMLDECNPRR